MNQRNVARNDILNITDLDGFDSEGFNVPLDFKINDFRNLSSRQGTNSKTIKVPGTKKNDSIFSWRFQLDSEGFYDDNAATPVVVERENIRIVQGSLQLFKVLTSDQQVVEYHCAIYSDNAEWFTKIESGSIQSLDLGIHVWDEATVRASWPLDADDLNYVYGLVDYGYFTDKDDADDIEVERVRPAVYTWNLIKKIIDEAGFTIKSEFLTRTEIKNHTLLFTNGDFLTDPKGEFRAELSSRQVIGKIAGEEKVVLYDNDLTGGNFDPDQAYNTTTGKWVCPQNGKYTIKSSTILATDRPDVDPGFPVSAAIRIENNDTLLSTTTVSSVPMGGTAFIQVNTTELSLLAGDVIHIEVEKLGTADYFLFVEPESFFTIDANEIAEVGAEIPLNKNVPDIRKRDLIKWAFAKWNLVATTNNVTGEIEIEQRDNFYGTIDDADDWSDIVDYAKEIEFTKITEGLSKELQLHFVRDRDDDNLEAFKETYKIGFGDHTEVLENEFLKGETNLIPELFAATWMERTFSETLYMPVLINDEELDRLEDNGETREKFDWEPREAYYNGLQDGDWTFEGSSETEYPQMIFIKENSRLKDVSLSYGDINDTDPNLQAKDVGLKSEYQSLFDNINFGRLVTLYLKLDPVDILNLDFRKLKFLNINGEKKYFILNKIENYIPGAPVTTKVELIEWKPSRSVRQAEAEIFLGF